MSGMSMHRALNSAIQGRTPSDPDSDHASAVSHLTPVTLPKATADNRTPGKATPVDLSKPAHADTDMHVSGADGSPVMDTAGRY